jgi:hypothetical protein
MRSCTRSRPVPIGDAVLRAEPDRIMSPQQLPVEKTGDPRPPRETDVQDIAILRQITSRSD